MPSSHVPRPGRPNSQCYGRYTIQVNCEQAANRIDRKGFTGPWDSEPSQMFKSQSSLMKDQQTPAEVVRSLPSKNRRLNHAVVLHQARYEHGSSGKVASEAEQQVRVSARQRRATLINLALDILNRQHCVPVMENLTVLGSNLDQDPNLRKQRGQPTARITTGVHCQNSAPIIIKIGHKREPRLSELVLNPVPNHVGETAVWPSTPILFDKVALAGWKTGPGRKKDWKTSQYINLPRKLKEMGLQSSDRSFRSILPYWTSSEAVGCPFHAGMPLNMLRYKAQYPNNSRSTTQPIAAWFRRELSFHAPKGLRPRNHASKSSLEFQEYEDYDSEEYRALDVLEDNLRIPEDQGAFLQHSDPTMSDIEDHKSLSLTVIAPSAVLPASGHSARGRKAKARPATHLIPYESFIGSHLGRSFRLIGLVSCERHYDLYNVECLYDPNRQYEARAYQLRGIVAKEREKRVRSLRRCSANPCVVGRLEQGGKKWVVSQSASGALEKPILTCPVKNGHGREYQSEGRSVKDVRARSVGKPRSNETPVETRVPPSKVKPRVSESKRLYTQKSPEQVKRATEKQRHARQKRRAAKAERSRKEGMLLKGGEASEDIGRNTCKCTEHATVKAPRVFMQWEEEEVQRLLRNQRLDLEKTHEKELRKVRLQGDQQTDYSLRTISKFLLAVFLQRDPYRETPAEIQAAFEGTFSCLCSGNDDIAVAAMQGLIRASGKKAPALNPASSHLTYQEIRGFIDQLVDAKEEE